MSDAPLSRRARRTFEEEAADRAALQDPTLAFGQGPTSGEIDAAEEARAALSRRDRRRMERLNHPLEAWTAEEEMLATGQIPAMTPERIAEQERISREKAARAAEEATAASQEFRRVAEADVRRAPAPVAQAPVAQAPVAQAPVAQAPAAQVPASQAPVAQVPVAQAPAAQVPASQVPASQPQWAEEPPMDFPGDFEFASKPVWPEEPASAAPHSAAPNSAAPTPPGFDMPESRQPAPDAHEVGGIHAADPHEGRPVVEAYQPIMTFDDAPLVSVVHPVHDGAPVEAQQSADEQSPMRSSVFDALFPPGSSQTALRQQDPFVTGLTEEPAPAASRQIPTLLPPQEVPERAINPVEEIRRLAAEAMSGIERASRADEAAAAATAAAGPTADPSARAQFDSLPTGQAPSTARPLDNFAWGEVVGGSPSANQAGNNGPVDSIGDWAHSAQHAPATPSGGMTPQHAGFDQLAEPYSGSAYGSAPASGEFPMHGQQGQPLSGQFPMPEQLGRQPAPQGLGEPQGHAWNSQPLLYTEQGQPAEAQAFTPLSNVPKPDFSGLYQQGSPSAFPPLTGAINTAALNAAEFHGGDLSASGRGTGFRRLELPEVGGVKHFKWLHLAVIGALMFVLGVVIYNVAFNK